MRSLYRISLFLLFLLPAPFFAFAQWQQPTPEELSMTSDPAAPGADAVYLYREETTNDNFHTHTVYCRLKILTEKGREELGDVVIPYEGDFFHIRAVEGRTIHKDGTIVPFTGKARDRVLEKNEDLKVLDKVFSMPDVQVGSILEYRYDLQYGDDYVVASRWYIQQPFFVHKAHYVFVPFSPSSDSTYTATNGMFIPVAFEEILPKGVHVQHDETGKYTLDISNVPARLSENYLPPFKSMSYRVLFFFTENNYQSLDEFWRAEGKTWSKQMDKFASPSRKLTSQAKQLVAGVNTPAGQLKELYDAVMAMENTDFTREHTKEENKAEKISAEPENSDDIFERKRGNSQQLALLFIALSRSAGFKAYAMQVTNRDRDLFQKAYPSLDQLDDVIAIVDLDGKEIYFDPGERYCLFGSLAWRHTEATGLRQTDHGTEIATTPSPAFKENPIQRVADVSIDSSGKVQGSIRIFLGGEQALYWRQLALKTDETEIHKEFEEALQKNLPPGVEVKTKTFLGLDNPDQSLMVLLDVSGSMGTATAKRIFLPSFFFETSKQPLFSKSQREGPIDLHYPYIAKDDVTIDLPPGSKLESAPKDIRIPFQDFAYYGTQVKVTGSEVSLARIMALSNVFYKPSEYPELKGFLDKVNANDKEQIVLERSAPGGSGQ